MNDSYYNTIWEAVSVRGKNDEYTVWSKMRDGVRIYLVDQNRPSESAGGYYHCQTACGVKNL